jgi:hypothetical protein
MRYLDWPGAIVLGWVSTAALALGVVLAAVGGHWWGVVWFGIACLLMVGALRWLRGRVAAVLFPLTALALAVNIAGYTWNLFRSPGAYDEVVHGYTIAVIALAYGVLVIPRVADLTRRSPARAIVYIITVASFGLAVAALWEIVEWALNQIPGVMIATGYVDTIWDLIADAAGAIVAALACAAAFTWGGVKRARPGRSVPAAKG